MKKILVFSCVFMLAATMAFGAAFAPQVLKLAAPGTMHYEFSGQEFKLPVTVSGKSAAAVFFVYTKDKASSIQKVKNGHLGWHYMNRVDTCVYMSGTLALNTGSNTILWDGKDIAGKMLPSGDYTYYLWAYDATSAREVVCLRYGGRQNCAGHIQMFDKDNNPLTNPVFYPPAESIGQIAAADGGWNSSTSTPGLKTRARWTIGTDPMDSTLVETTTYRGWGDSGKLALMPGNHNYYFVENYIPKAVIPNGLHHVMKWKWVPNGLSEQDVTFGDNGSLSFNNTSAGYAGPISDNVSSLWAIVGDNSYPTSSNPANMYFIDPTDGTLLRTYDFKWLWWDQAEVDRGEKYHGGPTIANFRNGRIYCAGLSFCMKHCIDPYQENDDDMTLWYNGNGDYVGDRFFQADAGTKAWLCSGGSGAPWVYDYTADKNGFNVFSAYDLGAVTFGLMGPDGKGVGYFALPGETAAIKYGQIIVDSGSAFDGIYSDNTANKIWPRGLWYTGYDSIKGTITTNDVGVKDAAPAAFSVAQNTPNPFNPSTTISFSMPQAGNVTIAVFNTAGQKVATVSNGFMPAGSHSVVWDASKFSAGVYFCTVSTGNFSKTLKMTLLK